MSEKKGFEIGKFYKVEDITNNFQDLNSKVKIGACHYDAHKKKDEENGLVYLFMGMYNGIYWLGKIIEESGLQKIKQ